MSQPTNPYEPPRETTERADMKPGDTYSGVAISFSGKLSVQDSQEAIRLVKKQNGKFSVWGDRIIGATALVFLIGLCIHSVSIFGIRSLHPIMILPCIALIILTVRLVFVPWWSNRKLNKRWTEGKGLFAPVDGQVDWQSFNVKTEHSSIDVLWSNFCGYRCSDRVVILFEEFPHSIAIHSKNRFEKDDWDAFLKLVAEKLPAV